MARIKSSLVTDIAKVVGDDEFVIVELTKDGPRPVFDPKGQLMKFTTGKEASDAARNMSTGGKKYQPRRVKDDKWQERERARYLSKEYKPLPWAEYVWWKNHEHIHGQHFPHVSVKNSVGLMAFTESDEKGSADIQTAIKPGKYLERYFSSILDPYIIRDLSTQFSNVFEDNCLLFADSEDEFEELYTKGPSSCMSHPKDKYLSHIHPVRVYAAGDLKLVYMKRDGRIVARALCWPERKLYSRVYGDAGRIEPLLRKEGYSKGAPYGAKLQRVITWENKTNKSGNQAFVVPHIDDASYVVDKGSYLEIGDARETLPKKGGIRIAGANGLSEWVFLRCSCCGKDSEGSASTIVYVDASGRKQERWCPTCVEEKSFMCDRMNTYVSKDFMVTVANGERWCTYAVREYGFTCAKTNQIWDARHRITLREGNSMVLVSKTWFKANGGHTCDTCGHSIVGECSPSCEDRSIKGGRQVIYETGYTTNSSAANIFIRR